MFWIILYENNSCVILYNERISIKFVFYSAVCQPGGEDGEVSGSAKYKPEKLVDFPGFNSPLPEGCIEVIVFKWRTSNAL